MKHFLNFSDTSNENSDGAAGNFWIFSIIGLGLAFMEEVFKKPFGLFVGLVALLLLFGGIWEGARWLILKAKIQGQKKLSVQIGNAMANFVIFFLMALLFGCSSMMTLGNQLTNQKVYGILPQLFGWSFLACTFIAIGFGLWWLHLRNKEQKSPH